MVANKVLPGNERS